MIKDSVAERKAQIADAVVRDWEKFDKNRVGMLSQGQVKFMMQEMLKKLDPTQLFKLEQTADKAFEEFYD